MTRMTSPLFPMTLAAMAVGLVASPPDRLYAGRSFRPSAGDRRRRPHAGADDRRHRHRPAPGYARPRSGPDPVLGLDRIRERPAVVQQIAGDGRAVSKRRPTGIRRHVVQFVPPIAGT